MIGLKRGAVKLLSHNRKWKNTFKKEKGKVLKAQKGVIVDLQHIGSTAIKGLTAKPIIDMSAGVKSLKDAEKLRKPLKNIGYNFYKKFDKQILFTKGPDEKRTHYLHVMKYNGAKWKNDILFRDFLLKNKKLVKEYSELKKKLAILYPSNRDKYTEGKSPFINETLKIARKNRDL